VHSGLATLYAVCLAIAPLGCAPSMAQGEARDKEQVRALEQRWLENEGNPELVGSILAKDFVHVLPAGFISREDHLRFLRLHPNAFPGSKHFEELRVRIYGNVAVATGIVSTLRAPGNTARTAFSDVFVRRNGEWLAVNAQELPLAQAATTP
jgi:hypothetical protein